MRLDVNELKEFALAGAKRREVDLDRITASLQSERKDTKRTIDKFLAEKSQPYFAVAEHSRRVARSLARNGTQVALQESAIFGEMIPLTQIAQIIKNSKEESPALNSAISYLGNLVKTVSTLALDIVNADLIKNQDKPGENCNALVSLEGIAFGDGYALRLNTIIPPTHGIDIFFDTPDGRLGIINSNSETWHEQPATIKLDFAEQETIDIDIDTAQNWGDPGTQAVFGLAAQYDVCVQPEPEPKFQRFGVDYVTDYPFDLSQFIPSKEVGFDSKFYQSLLELEN